MARLTAARRHALPKSKFAGNADKEEYPIDTRDRAIAALGYVKQYGSLSLQRQIHTAVCKAYPDLPACQSPGQQVAARYNKK